MDLIKKLRKDNKVDEAIERLGGNRALYLLICQKFVNDTNYDQYHLHMLAGELKAAGMNLHTLKGIAANLGFLKLELLCMDMLELIATGDAINLVRKGEALSKEYEHIIDILS